MQWYHYLLLLLKVVFLIEFMLVMYDKKLVSPKVYTTTEILFKLILSIYIQYIMIFVVYKNVGLQDSIFISFGGGLLMYDAIFNDIPDLLEMYGLQNTSLVK